MTEQPMTAQELAEARALVDSITGFEHRHYPDNPFGRNTLAELDADGKWRMWDMKAPYSTEACAFIAAAPTTIRRLLATVAALERQLADAERRLQQFDEPM